MRIGVAYYPELWDESYIEFDAKLMKEIGVTVIRVAEFAWSQMEPEEDRFTFDWLDGAIETMYRYGIQVILGTPTSAPPNWLMEKYPDVYIRDETLQPRYEGIRGHRCVNSPSLARRTQFIVEQMAKRYGNHPAVIGWQIDNEFEMSLCNCESCLGKFRAWTKAKYSTLECLNKEWGTRVWSGEYSSWSQLHTPRGGKRQLNPSFQLDYHRFQNESIRDYQQLQVDIIRKHCPAQFITHNMWEGSLPIDYYSLFENLDVAGTDYYIPSRADQLATAPYNGAYFLDHTRGFKRQNFWVMETISGSGTGGSCWGPAQRTMPPGFLRAVVWQTISRGADNVLNYLWRASLSGTEQLSSSIVGHSSIPVAHRLQEYAQTCGEVNSLSELLDGTTLRNEIALLYATEIHRAFQIQPQIEGGLNYDHVMKTYHTAINKLGAGTDVIQWTAPLDGYKIVIAPYMFLMDEELAAKLEAFAANGGTLVLTNRSGIKNMNNVVWPLQAPGLLAKCAGLVLEEWDPLGRDTYQVKAENGEIYTVTQWADIIQPQTARPIAWYMNDFYAGKPAVTVNEFGKGKVYYVGAFFENDYLSELFSTMIHENGIASIRNLPEGVHASVRGKAGINYLFLINFTRAEQTVELKGSYISLLRNARQAGSLQMKPLDVEILKVDTVG